MSKFIATFGYVGLAPMAPGTFGSLAALPVGLFIGAIFGPFGLVLATLIVFLTGWWATGVETLGQTDHDPSEIVIDEVAGQFLALLPMTLGALVSGSQAITVVCAFILFRLFDILKPFPVSWADKMDTPLGVMLDDILAGILAAVCLWLLSSFLA